MKTIDSFSVSKNDFLVITSGNFSLIKIECNPGLSQLPTILADFEECFSLKITTFDLNECPTGGYILVRWEKSENAEKLLPMQEHAEYPIHSEELVHHHIHLENEATGRHRVLLDFTAEALSELDDIVKRSHLPDRTETIRHALRWFQNGLNEVESGSKLLVERQDKNVREIIFPFWKYTVN